MDERTRGQILFIKGHYFMITILHIQYHISMYHSNKVLASTNTTNSTITPTCTTTTTISNQNCYIKLQHSTISTNML